VQACKEHTAYTLFGTWEKEVASLLLHYIIILVYGYFYFLLERRRSRCQMPISRAKTKSRKEEEKIHDLMRPSPILPE
jgi:hypothetical protein